MRRVNSRIGGSNQVHVRLAGAVPVRFGALFFLRAGAAPVGAADLSRLAAVRRRPSLSGGGFRGNLCDGVGVFCPVNEAQ